MKRENRYAVAKHLDIQQYLTVEERIEFYWLLSTVAKMREAHGRPPLQCVVVENDWPEYEPVWAMIEARVDSEVAVSE